MEFLAALIAVALVQLWGSGAPLHRDGWFLRWCHWCARLPGLNSASTLLPVVCVSIPVFVLLLIYYGIADQWWGLPKLAMLVAILLYSLGRGEFRRVPRSQALYCGFERMFAVLFWFVLAGPALALAYRLAFLYRHRVVEVDNSVAADKNVAVALSDQLLALFEWLPARALGISFAVICNVRDGAKSWIDLLWQHGNATSAYLDAMYASVSGVGSSAAQADDELRQIQVVLNRSLIVWLAALALVQLIL